jgi:hypothetical protein
MTPDVATGDPNAMLCLHCASRIVSPRTTNKYDGLKNHLKFRGSFVSMVKLKFARIDGLIGANLPMAAYRDEAWWSNTGSTVHSKAWLDAGWEVEQVNLKEGYVVFRRCGMCLLKSPDAKSWKSRSRSRLFPCAPSNARNPQKLKSLSCMRESKILNVNVQWVISRFAV